MIPIWSPQSRSSDSRCLQDLPKPFWIWSGRTHTVHSLLLSHQPCVGDFCVSNLEDPKKDTDTRRTWSHKSSAQNPEPLCSEVTVLTAASHACWPGVLYKNVMDGGWPWEKLFLSVCLLWDAQVNESPEPGGPINTACDFTSYMPCPGHSCPSLDNFVAHREDWLARQTLYSTHAAHLFRTVFHSPPKIQNWTTVLLVNQNNGKLKTKKTPNCLKWNCDFVKNYGIWLQLQSLFSISDILKYFSPNLKLGYLKY